MHKEKYIRSLPKADLHRLRNDYDTKYAMKALFSLGETLSQNWSKINREKRGREDGPGIRSLHYPGSEGKMRNNSCKLQLHVNFDRRFTGKENQAGEGVGIGNNGKKWNSDLYSVQPTRDGKVSR